MCDCSRVLARLLTYLLARASRKEKYLRIRRWINMVKVAGHSVMKIKNQLNARMHVVYSHFLYITHYPNLPIGILCLSTTIRYSIRWLTVNFFLSMCSVFRWYFICICRTLHGVCQQNNLDKNVFSILPRLFAVDLDLRCIRTLTVCVDAEIEHLTIVCHL